MKKLNWYLLSFTLVVLAWAVPVYAGYPPTLSVNRVPRESWTYDALALLAARDMIPGADSRLFYGDWLYTRREMAEYVAGAVRTLAEAPDDYKRRRALVSRLVDEFRPELDSMGLKQSEIDEALRGADDDSLTALAFNERLWLSDSDDDGTHAILADRETFIGSKNVHSPLFVVGVSNARKEFRTEPSEFPYLEKAFVKARWHEWDFQLGQDYLWWGPGYSGSMILSDNAPPFAFFKVGKDFSLGRAIGRLKVDEFISPFNDDGDTYWFVGRRWEKTLSSRWNIALNETAKMKDRPNPLILILPIYLYEHIYLDDVDETFNALYGLDVTYSFANDSSAYLEFIVDDMTAPGFLPGSSNDRPQKLGWLLGANHNFSRNTSLRLEYILTDAGTYLSTRPDYPQLSYTRDGFVIGHPVGANSKAIYARLEQKLSTKLDGVVEYLWRGARDPAGVNPGDEKAYDAFLSYGIKPQAALWLRAQRLLGPSADDRLQLGASYTF